MNREEYDTAIIGLYVDDENDTKSDIHEKFYNFEIQSNAYIYSLEQRIKELECARNLSIVRIKELEAQLTNAEQLTCETCKWRNCLVSEMEPCRSCLIKHGYGNYYQPKDTK